MGKKYLTDGKYVNPFRMKSEKAVSSDLIRKMMRHQNQIAAHVRAHVAGKLKTEIDGATYNLISQMSAMLNHGYTGLPTTKGIWYRNHARQILAQAEYKGEQIYEDIMRQHADMRSSAGTAVGTDVPQPPRPTMNPVLRPYDNGVDALLAEIDQQNNFEPDPQRRQVGNE